MIDLPAGPGSYILQIALSVPARLRIGRLGEFDLPRGEYFYAGNAFGPGGLRARILRYLRDIRRTHWHIDYFLPHSKLNKVYFTLSDQPLECVWSQALADLPGAQIPVVGFGSSDCKSGCKAHLILLPHVKHDEIFAQLQILSHPAGVKVRRA